MSEGATAVPRKRRRVSSAQRGARLALQIVREMRARNETTRTTSTAEIRAQFGVSWTTAISALWTLERYGAAALVNRGLWRINLPHIASVPAHK